MRADHDKRLGKERRIAVWRNRGAHVFQSEKQQTEAGQDASYITSARFFSAQQQRHADPQQQRGEELRTKQVPPFVHRDKPCGQRRADVRTHDDAHGLAQRHHAGIHESYCHDRGQ